MGISHKANCQGCGHWFLTEGSQGRMTLAQGRLGRAWMSLTSSLSGCHFDEESAKGASGLNWSCIGLFCTYESCEYLRIFVLYIIRMHLHVASHQSFGVLRCCCYKPLLLLIDPVKVPAQNPRLYQIPVVLWTPLKGSSLKADSLIFDWVNQYYVL